MGSLVNRTSFEPDRHRLDSDDEAKRCRDLVTRPDDHVASAPEPSRPSEQTIYNLLDKNDTKQFSSSSNPSDNSIALSLSTYAKSNSRCSISAVSKMSSDAYDKLCQMQSSLKQRSKE